MPKGPQPVTRRGRNKAAYKHTCKHETERLLGSKLAPVKRTSISWAKKVKKFWSSTYAHLEHWRHT